MPVIPLPSRPDLAQLRRQAKELHRALLAGEVGAVVHAEEHHPGGPHTTLAGAQLVVARHYGFSSWARLKKHLTVVVAFSREPDEVPVATSPADEFLRLACLTYGADEPARRDAAGAILAAHPELSAKSLHVAAATADVAAARKHLRARDPNAEGGPFGWAPLLYLAYARHDPAIPSDAVLATAKELLDAGADPNAGFLWHGLPTPFTVLTGVFGAGERDQPPHPHSVPLARLLLEGGADPNDGQALYNRMFRDDDDHLVLLLEFGLGSGDGGPWRARLGHAVQTPVEMVGGLLLWAVTHDQRERVRLLLAHGVQASAEGARAALVNGNLEVYQALRAAGAPEPELDPVERYVAAVLGPRPDGLEGSGSRGGTGLGCFADENLDPGLALALRPGLIVWAIGSGRADALEVLVRDGFDVNAMGRGDTPREQPWQTPLHEAVARDDVATARRLLELGADKDLRDARFDQTPLGWARHFGHQRLVELLVP